MAKILLVEDDQNLREIFEMRLQAEGYQTVTASDGEEALTVAMKEKPDLIICDVMMPKLSGFEMLETLRSAPEMAKTKVVMMTALGQAEDQARGARLGVLKYLVKSQVTLEDFVRVVREVLRPDQAKAPADPGTSSQTSSTNNNKEESEKSMDDSTPTNPPAGPMPPSGDGSSPSGNPMSGDPAAPASDGQMSTAQEQNAVNGQVSDFAANTPTTPPADGGAGGGMPPADAGSGDSTPPASPPADGGTPPADGGAMPPAGGGA